MGQSNGKFKPQNGVDVRRSSNLSAPEVTSPSRDRKSPIDEPTDDIDKKSSEMSPRRSISRNSYREGAPNGNNGPSSAENMSMYLPKINYVTLMLGRETEASENMESLALKYLKVGGPR